jgi:hypothetical protein
METDGLNSSCNEPKKHLTEEKSRSNGFDREKQNVSIVIASK